MMTCTWYLVLGQYNLVLLGIKWNWVSTMLLCLCILRKQVEIWSDVTLAGRTNKRMTNKVKLLAFWKKWTPSIDQKWTS